MPPEGGYYNWNNASVGNKTVYNTQIKYFCNRGRMFRMPDMTLVDKHKKLCLWNQTWDPPTEVSSWNYVP